MDLTHLSLFSGVGGIDLAAEWANFRTVGQVEIADYQYAVLCKHWPDVPKWRDIKDVTGDTLRRAGIAQPTLLSGSFPCQGFSVAGKRLGTEDDRYLWPEMYRLVRELRPAWVIGENVTGIVDLALDIVLADLERAEYSARAFNIPACGVGALHRRARIFIVAHRDDVRCELRGLGGEGVQRENQARHEADTRGLHVAHAVRLSGAKTAQTTLSIGGDAGSRGDAERCGLRQLAGTAPADVADTDHPRLQGHGGQHHEWLGGGELSPWSGGRPLEGIWLSEPRLDRVALRTPDRVDRLICLGNIVVPQQVYPILKAIADIERGVIT